MNDKERLEKARDLLIQATKLLSEGIEGSNNDEKIEDWMKNRIELWCRIYNVGGLVTKDKLHEIWEVKMKKDTRGLGGFFVGKGASLTYTTDEKVILTKKAAESIFAWTGKEISEYAKKYK